MHYEYELGKAGDTITRELLDLKAGETLVITADTESDPRVVNATARSAFSIGSKPAVIWLASPLGVGQAADPMLPIDTLVGALKGADAWVEFNNQWLIYSTVHTTAMEENPRLRYLNLVGMNTDMMVRCVGRVNHRVLSEFLHEVTNRVMSANHVRMTSPGGTDLEFHNYPGRAALVRDGYATAPGTYMMAGMIAWCPDMESINGTLVFDGSLIPPCGKLERPVRLRIENGEIIDIEGDAEATQVANYLDSFEHPQMKRLAHCALGFGPGARLSADIVENERIWGCTDWGIGHIGKYLLPPDGAPAPSHSDGQSLNISLWLDERIFLEEGQVVDPALGELAAKLRKH